MRRYDPDWLADGRPDRRCYPIYLIALFWSSVAVCLLSVVGLAASLLVADRVFAATLFLVLAAGLASLGLVREKAKIASVR